jgi:hypothetical protein
MPAASAGYRSAVSGTVPPGSASRTAKGSTILCSAYLPGPQFGSVSGNCHDTAYLVLGPMMRDADDRTAVPRAVLSMTICCGKPVCVCERVRVSVWLRVAVWLLLCVSVSVRVGVCDGDCVGLGVSVCVGVGEQTRLMAKSIIPGYGVAACHVAPPLLLVHPAKTLAEPGEGR